MRVRLGELHGFLAALPPENLEGMDEVVEDLTAVKVPGSGHFVPWEAPEAVNTAMDELQRTC